jgi:hypothetical protein
MGSALSCSCQDAKQYVLEAEGAEEKIEHVVHDVEKTAEDAEQVAAEGTELAQDSKQLVAEAAKLVGDSEKAVARVVAGDETVEDAMAKLKVEAEEVVATVGEVKEEAVLAGGEAVQVVADAQNVVIDATSAVAKQGVETADRTMDAAVAAVTGVVIVDFVDGKGASQSISFASRGLGFEVVMGGRALCLGKAKAAVVVKSLLKGGQAEKLGVKRSWALKHVNGTEVTGLAQARELLAEASIHLPEA